MKKNKKRTKKMSFSLNYVIITFIISVLYTLLVKVVDVSDIGPQFSRVGFSTINNYFHNLTGYNDTWYNITKYLGIIPFLLVAYYGLIGLKQLLKKKSIKKVDKRLIILGCFYIMVLLCYIFFEKVIINYRPILIDGVLEASYPSSHTVLAITICLSSLLISKYYFKANIQKIVDIVTWILLIIIVVGRLLSGVHWLTDIIGGIIISDFLVTAYYYMNEKIIGE